MGTMPSSPKAKRFLLTVFFLCSIIPFTVYGQYKDMKGRFGAGGQIDDVSAGPGLSLNYWVANFSQQGVVYQETDGTTPVTFEGPILIYEPPLELGVIGTCPAPPNFSLQSLLVLQSDASIIRVNPVLGVDHFFIDPFSAGADLTLVGLDLGVENLQGVNCWGSSAHFYFSPNGADNNSRSSFVYPVYVWTNKAVYVSRDTGNTWEKDTAGLNATNIRKLDFDNKNNLYAATNNGLYVQDSVSSSWTKINSFPQNNVSRFYCTRTGDLYASASGTLYRSVNSGTSWLTDTTGLSFMALLDMCDDSLGNMYALMNTSQFGLGANSIFRKLAGQSTWQRIDISLSSQFLNPNASTPFNAIYAIGNIVLLGTDYGAFISTDAGNTWTPNNSGITSYVNTALVRANDGGLLLSNQLACHKMNAGDTSWYKVFPTNGYFGNQPLYRDNSGNLYTSGAPYAPSSTFDYNAPRTIYKSTDNGLNWLADSNGVSKVGMGSWFVDESGNQYAAKWPLGSGSLSLFKKPAGSPWQGDSTGILTGANEQPSAFGDDGNGNLFFATNSGKLFTRPLTGSTWVSDTAGLNGDILYSFAHTANHTLVAGGYNAAHYKQAGNWVNLPQNSPAPGGGSVFTVAVDDSNYLWAAFQHFNPGFISIGDGVFYTNDFGTTWHAAIGSVDTVTFKQLVPVGDSVIGVSYFNGLYVFYRNGGATPVGIHLLQPEQPFVAVYPNPASTNTKFAFSLEKSANVKLQIFDPAGRLVKTMAEQNLDAGEHNYDFDTRNLPSGKYLWRVNVDGHQQGGKFLVVR